MHPSGPGFVAAQNPAGSSPGVPPTLRPALLVLAVILLALNLRTTVASLPPLLATIQRDLGLTGPAAGVLTSLPVLCMAFFAPVGHRLAHRAGREATALGSVALIGLGNGLRFLGE